MKAKKLWCILAPLILVFIIAMIFVLVYILNKDKIDDIQVDSTNVETTIDWGEELDLSGLVVKVKYKSGKLKTLNSSDYQVDLGEFDNETAGNYKILIQYGRFKKELTITVAQPKVTQIILNTEQVQKTFAWGEKFNHNNIKVQAVLEDGTVENVKEGDYKILNSSYDAYFPGEYKIRVYVENLSVFYTVTVQDLPSDQVQKV